MMRIETKIIPQMTIEEFADQHDLVMQVIERPDRLANDSGRFYAQFKNTWTLEKEGRFIVGSYGDGSTPENAIKNYAKKISQVTLTDDVSGHTRREIRTPRFVERNHDGFRVSLTHNHDPLAVCNGCLKFCDIILHYKTLKLYLCTACAEETMRVIQMDIGRHGPS